MGRRSCYSHLMVADVQLLNHVRLLVTPRTAARQAFLSITTSWSLLKLMSIESAMPSNHLILCHSLLLLPSIFPSIRSSQHPRSCLYQVAEVLEFQLQQQSFQWIFRTTFLQDWLVGSPCCPRDSQESSPTPQFKSINSSVLSFFIIQLSHPYLTTGKTRALTRQTFVDKVMSLLFNILSRLVIAFLPRSKHLLIHGCSHHLQWFWSPRK